MKIKILKDQIDYKDLKDQIDYKDLKDQIDYKNEENELILLLKKILEKG